MKIKTSLLLLVVVLCLAACKKDNYSLPPETQTGANTFGCKINGKVWVPNGSDIYSGRNVFANYINNVFIISATNFNSKPQETFVLGTDNILLFNDVLIRLDNGAAGGLFYTLGYNGRTDFGTNSNYTGELKFKKFDETNLIASGTFWFDAQNANGEIIRVTEGRFDVKFSR
jgi:hypothetical protein